MYEFWQEFFYKQRGDSSQMLQILPAMLVVQYNKIALNARYLERSTGRNVCYETIFPLHQSADEQCLGRKSGKRQRLMCMLIVS